MCARSFTFRRQCSNLFCSKPLPTLWDRRPIVILPLDKLIGNVDNVYELTCAAIRRAAQITLAGDEDIEENDGKVVSTAVKQILTKKVEYRLEQ